MKQRATVERRKERQEFVYKYRNEMRALMLTNKIEDRQAFVNQYARPELKYSANTDYRTIFFSLKNDFLFLNLQ
jgi:hypothetical protein